MRDGCQHEPEVARSRELADCVLAAQWQQDGSHPVVVVSSSNSGSHMFSSPVTGSEELQEELTAAGREATGPPALRVDGCCGRYLVRPVPVSSVHFAVVLDGDHVASACLREDPGAGLAELECA